MFNRERTLQIFGYDIDMTKRRRTKEEIESTGGNSVKKKQLLVVDNCPGCSKERTITLRQSKKNTLCYKCLHNTPKMLKIKRNLVREVSEETRQKMRENHWSTKGYQSAFKGKKHTQDTKLKLSRSTAQWYRYATDEEIRERSIKALCSLRSIPVEEFDGWATTEGQRLRGTKEYKEFEDQVRDRDKRCQYPTCSEYRRTRLTVHHKDGFHWCIERRTDPENGVLLCHNHHEMFHNAHGRRGNTEIQFLEWFRKHQSLYNTDVRLIVLGGVSGSGKSWIANQLLDKFAYVPYDRTAKEQHLLQIIQTYKDTKKPVIYDPFRKCTTIYNRYSKVWSAELVIIDEPFEVIKQRLLGRDGTISSVEKIAKAIKMNATNAKNASFSGTSQEVLDYLKSMIQ